MMFITNTQAKELDENLEKWMKLGLEIGMSFCIDFVFDFIKVLKSVKIRFKS